MKVQVVGAPEHCTLVFVYNSMLSESNHGDREVSSVFYFMEDAHYCVICADATVPASCRWNSCHSYNNRGGRAWWSTGALEGHMVHAALLTQPPAAPGVDLPELDAFLQSRGGHGALAGVGLSVAGAQRLVARGAGLRQAVELGLAGQSLHPAHGAQAVLTVFARV